MLCYNMVVSLYTFLAPSNSLLLFFIINVHKCITMLLPEVNIIHNIHLKKSNTVY